MTDLGWPNCAKKTPMSLCVRYLSVRIAVVCPALFIPMLGAPPPAEARAQLRLCPVGAASSILWNAVDADDNSVFHALEATIFPAGIWFGGRRYDGFHVNVNGSISAARPLSLYTPAAITRFDTPIIAPYMADVDLRHQPSGLPNPGQVTVCSDTIAGRVLVTWRDVTHFDATISTPYAFQPERLNSFQLILADAGVVCEDGAERRGLDVELRYEKLSWYAGRASGGNDLGECNDAGAFECAAAAAGIALGDSRTGVALPGSHTVEVARSLLENSNVGIDGVYRYRLVDGVQAICGDGVLAPCESCDDGNTEDGDGCSAGCVAEHCGDGLVQPASGEQCDDGNRTNGDGCSTTCRREDRDVDAILDFEDNCPEISNHNQADIDGDGVGNACEDSLGILGGLACSAGRIETPGWTWLLVLLCLIASHMRRAVSRATVGCAFCLMMTLASAPGLAQSVHSLESLPADPFRLAVGKDGLLDVEWAAVPGHGHWDIGLSLIAIDQPVVLYVDDDSGRQPVASLLSRRITGYIMASLSLWHRVQLALDVPAALYQNGEGIPDVMLGELASMGMGDVRLVSKLQLMGAGRRSSVSGTNLAVLAAITLPSAGNSAYLGEAGPSFTPVIALSRTIGPVRASGNMGYRARKNIALPEAHLGDEILALMGAGYRVSRTLELDASLSTAVAAAAPFTSFNHDRVEALAGVRYDLSPGLVAMVAAGMGLEPGLGSPRWRIVLELRATSREREYHATRARPTLAENRLLADRHDSVEHVPDSDGDQQRGVIARCPAESEDMNGFADDHGCPALDNNSEGASNLLDRCPGEPGQSQEDGCKRPAVVLLHGRSIITVERLYFSHGTKLPRSSLKVLDELAETLREHPEITQLRVEGHADSQGDPASKQELSERRAQKIVDLLVERGVDRERLIAVGFGDGRPIADNQTARGRARNRRVEFHVEDAGENDIVIMTVDRD